MLFELANKSRSCSLWKADSQTDSRDYYGLAHSGWQAVRQTAGSVTVLLTLAGRQSKQTGSQTPTHSRGHADSCNSNNLFACRSATMATAPLGRAACCRATFAMGFFVSFNGFLCFFQWVTTVSCDGFLLFLSIGYFASCNWLLFFLSMVYYCLF